MWNRSHNDGIFFHIIISFIDYVKVGETLKHYLIAHDLGTSGDKATLFDVEGNLIRSVTTPYETHFFNANWAEQNPQNWWEAFCASTKQLVCEIDAKEVAAVSFSGQMMGCVPVDMSGKAIRPAIIWGRSAVNCTGQTPCWNRFPLRNFTELQGIEQAPATASRS